MKSALAVLTLLAALAFAGSSAADVPTTLNYQGKLTTASGVAVPDGTYGIKFSLWTAATGGSLQYSQDRSVAVVNGVFDAVIGGSGVMGWPDFSSELWIQLEVTPPGAAGPEAPLPRQRLTSTPYAQNARTVQDDAITSVKIADGAVATADLGAEVVTTAKIDDRAVTTAKIGDDAVTPAKVKVTRAQPDSGYPKTGTIALEVFGEGGSPSYPSELGDKVWAGSITLDEPSLVFFNVALRQMTMDWNGLFGGAECSFDYTLRVGGRIIAWGSQSARGEKAWFGAAPREKKVIVSANLTKLMSLGAGSHAIEVHVLAENREGSGAQAKIWWYDPGQSNAHHPDLRRQGVVVDAFTVGN